MENEKSWMLALSDWGRKVVMRPVVVPPEGMHRAASLSGREGHSIFASASTDKQCIWHYSSKAKRLETKVSRWLGVNNDGLIIQGIQATSNRSVMADTGNNCSVRSVLCKRYYEMSGSISIRSCLDENFDFKLFGLNVINLFHLRVLIIG